MAKLYSSEPGYVAERYNAAAPGPGGTLLHNNKVVIYDRYAAGYTQIGAESFALPELALLGRYVVRCKAHEGQPGSAQATTSMKKARALMKSPASWCAGCDASTAAAENLGAEFVHIHSLLASLAIDPALEPDVMRIVERHILDIDNDPRRPTPCSC